MLFPFVSLPCFFSFWRRLGEPCYCTLHEGTCSSQVPPDHLTRRVKLHCCSLIDCFHVCRSFKRNLCCFVERCQVSKTPKTLHSYIEADLCRMWMWLFSPLLAFKKKKKVLKKKRQNVRTGLLENASKIEFGRRTCLGLRKPVFSRRVWRQEKPDDSALLLAFRLLLFWAWVVN